MQLFKYISHLPPGQYFNSMEREDIKKYYSIKISFTRHYSDLHEGCWGEREIDLRMVYKLVLRASVQVIFRKKNIFQYFILIFQGRKSFYATLI